MHQTARTTAGWRLGAASLLVATAIVLAIALALSNGPAANAQEETGTLTVEVAGDTGSQDFTIEATLDGETDPEATFTLATGETDAADVPTGDYIVEATEQDGFVFEGFGFAFEDVCPAEPSTTSNPVDFTIEAENDAHLCAYFSPDTSDAETGTLTVIKNGAEEGDAFNVEVTGEDDEVVDTIEVTGEGTADLPAGDYTISELESQDYVFVGWATPEEGVCPAEATSTDETFDVTIEAETETEVCLYNEPADPTEPIEPGTLTIIKNGAEEGDAFNVEVTGEDDEVVDTIAVIGEGTAELPAGDYAVSELESQDYVFAGWAASEDGVCPALATSTDATFDVTIEAEAETVICLYNEPAGTVVDGTLTVIKNGAPSSASFNVEVTDLEDTVVDSIVLDGGEAASTNLPGGEYRISELEAQSWVFEGWALADEAGVCPAEPTDTDVRLDVTITPAEETVVCLYNAPDGTTPPDGDEEFVYDLFFRWSLIAWVGEDGAPVSTALGDIAGQVTAIWHWDATTQQYEGYFPGEAAATNDFDTFTRYESYWIAIDEDVNADTTPDIEWEIVKGDDDPSPSPTTTTTPTPTETSTATETPTETVTETPSATATETATSTVTETPTETVTETPTETATESPTETATGTPSETPTEDEL